jgi:hypothetical protein
MEELNVTTHERAIAARQRIRTVTPMHDTLEPEATGLLAWVRRHFEFPKGEFAIVTNRGDKISLPTPLIGVLVGLFMWLIGGTIGFAYFMGRMSTSVETLNASFLEYRIRSDAEKKAMQEKLDLQQMYIQNDRERLARLEAREKKEAN